MAIEVCELCELRRGRDLLFSRPEIRAIRPSHIGHRGGVCRASHIVRCATPNCNTAQSLFVVKSCSFTRKFMNFSSLD